MATSLKTDHIQIVNKLCDIPEKERNLCLVVEFPKVGCEGSYRRASSPNLSINFERWKYVSDLHVVMPNFRQLYIFRTLEWKHYHCDREELSKAVKKSQLDIDVHIYPPNENVLDSKFAKVINVNFDTRTMALLNTIPWKKMAASVYQDTVSLSLKAKIRKKPAKKPAPGTKKPATPKRQQFFKDSGYTGGQCLIDKDSIGVAMPALKPSTDQFHIKAMVALSALLKNHVFQELQETVFFDAENITRCHDFAQKLHPDNVLESLRAALSNVLNPCGCHDDAHNDRHPNFAPVITFSIFLKIDGVYYRFAIIGYSRMSIRQYYERTQQPGAILIRNICSTIEGLPMSRRDWLAAIEMINGRYDMNHHPRIGGAEQGFYVDYCHMNMYHYLSAWIHYASQLVTRFSLSYEDTVGLLVGMYVDNNAVDFVAVAKDLMEQKDATVTVTNSDIGLLIRQRMVQKKLELKLKFGTDFTYPSRFRYCWQPGWNTKMLNAVRFRAQKALVVEECRSVMSKFRKVGHRDSRLKIYHDLSIYLKDTIFGAGALTCKHLISIMSVIGVLPAWMATTSFVKFTDKNYTWLVENARLENNQTDANSFLRRLAYAVSQPTVAAMPTVASVPTTAMTTRKRSATGSKGSGRSASPGEGKNVDLNKAENVICKYIIIKKERDTSLNVVFIHQSMYVPNVQNISLDVLSPGNTTVKTIVEGQLHHWDAASMGSPMLERTTRKQRTSVNPPPAPPPPVITEDSSATIWVPDKVIRSRGGSKRPPLEPKTVVDSIATHVTKIEREGGFSSHFDIVFTTTKDRKSYHSLVSVTVNNQVYLMERLDISVVYSVLGGISEHRNPTYVKKKDCVLFGHLFLLFIVYPRTWFPLLMGRPSVIDSPTPTVEVRRSVKHWFYLKNVEDTAWQITIKGAGVTYEYK
jgi:hypothetical protein